MEFAEFWEVFWDLSGGGCVASNDGPWRLDDDLHSLFGAEFPFLEHLFGDEFAGFAHQGFKVSERFERVGFLLVVLIFEHLFEGVPVYWMRAEPSWDGPMGFVGSLLPWNLSSDWCAIPSCVLLGGGR